MSIRPPIDYWVHSEAAKAIVDLVARQLGVAAPKINVAFPGDIDIPIAVTSDGELNIDIPTEYILSDCLCHLLTPYEVCNYHATMMVVAHELGHSAFGSFERLGRSVRLEGMKLLRSWRKKRSRLAVNSPIRGLMHPVVVTEGMIVARIPWLKAIVNVVEDAYVNRKLTDEFPAFRARLVKGAGSTYWDLEGLPSDVQALMALAVESLYGFTIPMGRPEVRRFINSRPVRRAMASDHPLDAAWEIYKHGHTRYGFFQEDDDESEDKGEQPDTEGKPEPGNTTPGRSGQPPGDCKLDPHEYGLDRVERSTAPTPVKVDAKDVTQLEDSDAETEAIQELLKHESKDSMVPGGGSWTLGVGGYSSVSMVAYTLDSSRSPGDGYYTNSDEDEYYDDDDEYYDEED